MTEHTNHEKLLSLIRRHGPGLASGAVTGALGFLAGDPATAAGLGAIGYGVTKALEKVGADVRERKLSPREQMRVGAVCAFVAAGVQERLDRGERLRDDGFFTLDEADRSAAEELLEGVILKCEKEHQEKKLRFVSNIFANAAFLDISPADANAVLSIAERLSYRQICILAAIGTEETESSSGYKETYRLDERLKSRGDFVVAADFTQLGDSLGLINCRYIPKPQLGNQRQVHLMPLGQICFRLMSLDTMPAEDVAAVVSQFEAALKPS